MYLKKSCTLPASEIQCNIHQVGSNSNESLSDFLTSDMEPLAA